MSIRSWRKNQSEMQNLKFYLNQIPSKPRGDYIDKIHEEWKGNYSLLESHHGYIQWLFPEETSGVNFHASPLGEQEAEQMRSNPQIKKRVYESFLLMLDFWGIQVETTEGDILQEGGKIYLKRKDDYKKRYLNWMGGHNNLRVCRCIKSLGLLGLEHLQPIFVSFLMHEIFDKQLKGCSFSFKSFWLPAVSDEKERERLFKIWKAWNKNRSVQNVVWKHSAECMRKATEEENPSDDSENTAPDSITESRDSTTSAITLTEAVESQQVPSKNDEDDSNLLHVSTQIPFTPSPNDVVDTNAIFDIKTKSHKRKRE